MAKRARLSGVSPLARASARSKVEDVQKILKDADSDGDSLLSLEELQSYLGDYLGYGQLEIREFFNEHKSEVGKVDLAGLQRGFARLNPYLIGKRNGCTIWRKPGAVCAPGAQVNIEDLVDCKVYICDKTEQTFVDECSGCEVLIGPCEGATFVRDCKNCTFWVVTRQLRTRGCTGCSFYLHSHTEPIIEASKELRFAPFAASYAGLADHMAAAKMDPGKNFWNAIYDFTGRADGANWRILSLGECRELELHDGDALGDWQCPSPELSHELLRTAPLTSDETHGQSMTQIPQTRPQLPEATGAKASREVVSDEVVPKAGPQPAPEAKNEAMTGGSGGGYPGATGGAGDETHGQSMTQIPQTRPQLPEATGAKASREVVSDEVVPKAGPQPAPEAKNEAMTGGSGGGYPGATGGAGAVAAAAPAAAARQKSKFIKVRSLTPDSQGVSLFAKVVEVRPKVDGSPSISEVVVGDHTGTITLRAPDPQVELCKPGAVLHIENAQIVMLGAFTRLEAESIKEFEANVKNDLSAVEYPRAD